MNGETPASMGEVPAPRNDRRLAEEPIKVLLIHGYRLLTDAVTSCLQRSPDFDLIGAATDLREALEHLRAKEVDVLLIDASIDLKRACHTVRELAEHFPGIKVLPLGLDEQSEIVKFIEVGAIGYVGSEVSFEEMLDCIRAAHDEQALCSPQVAASVFARVVELARRRNRFPRRLPDDLQLTPREQEVLQLLAAGLQNKEIARRLSIALPTVKNHVHKILDKLNVRRRREAIQLAYEGGLVDDPMPWSSAKYRDSRW